MLSLKTDWQNWGRTFHEKNIDIIKPTSIEDVQRFIQSIQYASKRVRPIGAGHSFSSVAKPDEIALDISALKGLKEVDIALKQATFYAGTHLYEVGPILERYGLALENMGDIDVQTIAGAISTGTHGTGITLGSLSNQITRWGVVTGTGEYMEIHRSDDAAKAMHISLGLLGVIVDVTIQAVPIYGLRYESTRISVADLIGDFEQTTSANRHAEWFYFPGQRNVQLKMMNAIPIQHTKRTAVKKTDVFIENKVLQWASTLCKTFPPATKVVSQMSAKAVPIGKREDVSYKLFSMPRQVRFVECEYAIPLANFKPCFEEIHRTLCQYPFDVHFPIEIRTQKGEMGILSPTQGEDCVFMAFHMYEGMPYKAYFNYVLYVMKKYGGRPHFGKMNEYDKEMLKTLYHDINIFLDTRKKFDPYGIFLTKYFEKTFNL